MIERLAKRDEVKKSLTLFMMLNIVVISVLAYKSMSIHPRWDLIIGVSESISNGISYGVQGYAVVLTLFSIVYLLLRGRWPLFPLLLLTSIGFLIFYNSFYSSISAKNAILNLVISFAVVICAMYVIREKEWTVRFLRFNAGVVTALALLNSLILIDLLNIIPLPFESVERPGLEGTLFRDYGIFGRSLISFTSLDSFAGLPRLAGYAYEPSNYAPVLLFGISCVLTVWSLPMKKNRRWMLKWALAIIAVNLFFCFSMGTFAALLIALVSTWVVWIFRRHDRWMVAFVWFLIIGVGVPAVLSVAKNDVTTLMMENESLTSSKGDTLEIKILRQATMWEMGLKLIPEGTDEEWSFVERNTSPVNFYSMMYVWTGLLGVFPFLVTNYFWIRGVAFSRHFYELFACMLAFSSIHFLSAGAWGFALAAMQMLALWKYHSSGNKTYSGGIRTVEGGSRCAG